MNRQEQVWDVARRIPSGRVSTYGAIAEFLGWPRGARQVGWAMAAAPQDVPAHRVVNRQGELSGRHNFTGGPDEMERRLQAEGIEVLDHRIEDFSARLWEPALELDPVQETRAQSSGARKSSAKWR